MPYVYPNEAVIRAFGLIFDGYSTEKASKILADFPDENGRSPSRGTLDGWAQKGVMPGGIELGISWYDIRDLANTCREVAEIRGIERRKAPMQYDEWIDQTRADLDTLQDMMMEHILPSLKFKPGDLVKIIEAKQLLEGKATQRIEFAANTVQILGQIINAAATHIQGVFKNPEVSEAMAMLIDLVGDEYQRYINHGGSHHEYEISFAKGKNRKRIQPGTEGS